MKKYKNTGTLEELVLSGIKTEEDIKEWLTISIEEFLEDGDVNSFRKAIEYAVKAKHSLSPASTKNNTSKTNFYPIFKDENQPPINVALKTIKELGYSLRIN